MKKFFRLPKRKLFWILVFSISSYLFVEQAMAQGFRDRLRSVGNAVGNLTDVIKPDAEEEKVLAPEQEVTTDTEANSEVANLALEEETLAAAAVNSCIGSSNVSEALSLTSVFAGANSDADLDSNQLSKYLIGFCVPDGFSERYTLTEYLITKGTLYNFYLERSLESLAIYLNEAGVEMGIKIEALENDSGLRRQLKKDNDMEKAEFMLSQDQYFVENIEILWPAIAELEYEQKTQALQLASVARGHALNSSFYLARGVYISQKIVQGLSGEALDELDNVTSGNMIDTGLSVFGRFGRRNETGSVTGFVSFIGKNGEALVKTLSNGVAIISTINPSVEEVPEISDEEINADVARLNEEWSLPAEFADEEAFAETNSFSLDSMESEG